MGFCSMIVKEEPWEEIEQVIRSLNIIQEEYNKIVKRSLTQKKKIVKRSLTQKKIVKRSLTQKKKIMKQNWTQKTKKNRKEAGRSTGCGEGKM